MSEKKEDVTQLFMLFIMALTRDVNDFQYKELKIGRLIFIINYIGYRKECTMKDIREYQNVKASTATKQLDKLVDMKIVQRISSENDRRNVLLTLTSLGHEIYAYHNEIQEKLIHSFTTKFSKEELVVVGKVISELTKNDRVIPTS